MADYRTDLVKLTEIFLDPENPRHDEIQSQRDLISAMIDDQGEKLVRLAKDIINSGINPSDIPILIPHSTEKNKYFVVEGNRRITALKILHEPSLCNNKKLSKSFLALKDNFDQNPINDIPCVIYNNRELSDHWVDLKHTGANNGIGTERWDTTAQRRRIDRKKKNPGIDLQLKNFLIDVGNHDPQTQRAYRSIDITTVKRLVGDPNVRKFLGLDLNLGILYSKLTLEETIRVLEDFFAPFATGAKNVTNVYHKDDRIAYIGQLDPSIAADKSKTTSKPWPLSSPPARNTTQKKATNPPATGNPQPGAPSTTTAQQPAKNGGDPPRTTSKPISINRKYLIDKPISISHNRINGIYTELRKLPVHDFPNAVAVLFRVFLELSLDNYINTKGINSHENDKLRNKVEKVADYIRSNNLLTDAQLKPARKAVSDNHSLFSTNTLNAYVHNSTIQPKPTELNATWDEMSDFLRQLWS